MRTFLGTHDMHKVMYLLLLPAENLGKYRREYVAIRMFSKMY